MGCVSVGDVQVGEVCAGLAHYYPAPCLPTLPKPSLHPARLSHPPTTRATRDSGRFCRELNWRKGAGHAAAFPITPPHLGCPDASTIFRRSESHPATLRTWLSPFASRRLPLRSCRELIRSWLNRCCPTSPTCRRSCRSTGKCEATLGGRLQIPQHIYSIPLLLHPASVQGPGEAVQVRAGGQRTAARGEGGRGGSLGLEGPPPANLKL